MTNNLIADENAAILDEIIMAPSNVIDHDHFSDASEQAACSGRCSSGVCHT